ncbi:hypothetical protein HZB00_02800 [Candidatus Woesearchaeota archaeon]|nr:hypothetical protein [Candidatus Woesearchaeota archaeon]
MSSKQDLKMRISAYEQRIARSEKELRQLSSTLQTLNKHYADGLISYETFQKESRLCLKGRTFNAWEHYYNQTTTACEARLAADRTLLEKQNKTKTILASIISLILLFATFGGIMFATGFHKGITGFAAINGTLEENTTLLDIMNTTFNETILTNITANETISLTNGTENGTASISKNSTNGTIQENNEEIENTTLFDDPSINFERGSEEKNVTWNIQILNKNKGRKTYFDGERDYDILPNSERLKFTNNSFKIAAKIRVNPSGFGTIASKHDYPNANWVDLLVDKSGTIILSAADLDVSINLETIKSFNDGIDHTIIAILNQTTAQIYVDGNLEAETDAPQFHNLNNEMPFSIGGNIGYIPWTGKIFNNFNGEIKEVKISYK